MLMIDQSGANELAERLGEFARASWLRGELKLAQTAMRKSLVLRPANAAMAGNLGSLQSEAHHVISKMRWGRIIDPTNPRVLHNVALAYARVGDCSSALSAWRLSVLWMPSSASSATGLSRTWVIGLDSRKRYAGDLIRCADWACRAAIIDPTKAEMIEFLKLLALVTQDQGFHLYSTKILKILINIEPLDNLIRTLLGLQHYNAGLYTASFIDLYKSLLIEPSGALAGQSLETLGQILGQNKRYYQAASSFERMLCLTPQRWFSVLPKLSSAFLGKPLNPNTIKTIRKAIVAYPGNDVIQSNYGGVTSSLGEYEISARVIKRARLINPAADLNNHWGALMLRAGRPMAAWAYFEAAVSTNPENVDAEFNCAKMRLALGDDEGGLRALRARWHITNIDAPYQLYPSPTLDLPVWDSQPVNGKRFFVWGEQGIGDDIWFAGRLNEFIEAGADIVFECSPKLKSLMSKSFPKIKVIARGEKNRDRFKFDYQLPVGFLVEYFHSSKSNYPTGYLTVNEDVTRSLRESYTDFGKKRAIGIAWRSTKPLAHRSFEAPLEYWGGLLRKSHYKFISLQYGPTKVDRENASRLYGVDIFKDSKVRYGGDLSVAAAQLAAVDAVVSIASTPITLAHALGRPAWAALRRSQEDWRYRIDSIESEWLPLCRSFWPRQNEGWTEVFNKIGCDLDEYFAKKPKK